VGGTHNAMDRMDKKCAEFSGKPEGMRPTCKWESNVKIKLEEVQCGQSSSGCRQGPWRAAVNTVVRLRVP
jgi:hypothetical protein